MAEGVSVWLERRSGSGQVTQKLLSDLVDPDDAIAVSPGTNAEKFWHIINNLDLAFIRDRNDMNVHVFVAGARPAWEAFPQGAIAKVYRSDLSRRAGLPGAGDMDEFWPRACATVFCASSMATSHGQAAYPAADSEGDYEFPWCNLIGLSSAADVLKFWFRDTTGASTECERCKWREDPEYRASVEKMLIRCIQPPSNVPSEAPADPRQPSSELCVTMSSTGNLIRRAHRATVSSQSRRSSGGSGQIHRRFTSTSSFDFTMRAADLGDLEPKSPRTAAIHRRTRSETSAWLSGVGQPSPKVAPLRAHGRSESSVLVPDGGLSRGASIAEDVHGDFGAVGIPRRRAAESPVFTYDPIASSFASISPVVGPVPAPSSVPPLGSAAESAHAGTDARTKVVGADSMGVNKDTPKSWVPSKSTIPSVHAKPFVSANCPPPPFGASLSRVGRDRPMSSLAPPFQPAAAAINAGGFMISIPVAPPAAPFGHDRGLPPPAPGQPVGVAGPRPASRPLKPNAPLYKPPTSQQAAGASAAEGSHPVESPNDAPHPSEGAKSTESPKAGATTSSEASDTADGSKPATEEPPVPVKPPKRTKGKHKKATPVIPADSPLLRESWRGSEDAEELRTRRKTRRGKRAGAKVREREIAAASLMAANEGKHESQEDDEEAEDGADGLQSASGSVAHSRYKSDDSGRFFTPTSQLADSPVAAPVAANPDITEVNQALFNAMHASAPARHVGPPVLDNDDDTVIADSSDDEGSVAFRTSLEIAEPRPVDGARWSAGPGTPQVLPSALAGVNRRGHGRSVSFGDPYSQALAASRGGGSFGARSTSDGGRSPPVGPAMPPSSLGMESTRQGVPYHRRQSSAGSLSEIPDAANQSWTAASHGDTDEFFDDFRGELDAPVVERTQTFTPQA